MRHNNRKNNELRNIKFTRDFTKHALGSVLVEFGETKVITTASVDFSKPKWMESASEQRAKRPAGQQGVADPFNANEQDKVEKPVPRGWVTAEYSLLPSSTSTRCKRERTSVSGRTQEIQRLIGRSLRACVDLNKMPDITIIVDADVIQADGGTRTASICGGFLALRDAVDKLIIAGKLQESPIIEPIGAISAGIVDGEVKLDLNYEEDCGAQVDANIVLTQSGKIIEFQTTAEGEPFSHEQLNEIFETAKCGIDEIIRMY